MKRLLYCFALLLTLSACQTNDFDDSYNDEEIDVSSYIPRKTGQDVKVIDTLDLDSTLKKYEKEYIVLGTSSFSGHWCSRSLAVETAKDKGATLIIIGIQPTGQSTETYAINIPQTNRVYHSGSFSGSSYTSGSIGGLGYDASTHGSGTYSGTSTYHTIKTVYNQKNNYFFKQNAYFLAKRKEENNE